jgi:hypothetical protein
VLTVNKRLLEWRDREAAQNVWLHGLYVYDPANAPSLIHWKPDGRVWPRLYVTNVTTHGGKYGFEIFSPAFLAGAQVAMQS